MKIPKNGVPREDVLASLGDFAEEDVDWHSGRVWALVYHAGDEHKQFLADAHAAYASANLLNPLAFRSLKKMEGEVVDMSASLLHAPDTAVGTMTSGGTESILLAVKAARDRAKKKRWWVRNPEMVVPESIHPAFHKAAEYFGVRMKRVALRDDFRVDVDALKAAVGRNTILIAASAPQYAHGVVDPIEAIGAYAAERSIPFHVDACFGGFILPWYERLGEPIPTFDFRVPGVTSMSADIHKFGYAAKGASVVLYRSMDYLRHQFHIDTDSPLGIYASPTIMGTRPGGPVAAAWATLMAMGEDGYLELAQRSLDARNALRDGLAALPEVTLLGGEDGPVVTWTTDQVPDGVNVYAVADQLSERGWAVERQQNPPCIHCTVTANHVDAVPDYIEAVRESIEVVRANPGLDREGEAAMYGMMAKIPIRGAVRMGVQAVMEAMHTRGETVDLGSIDGDDDGLLGMMGKYQDQAFEVLERVDGAKEKVKSWLDG